MVIDFLLSRLRLYVNDVNLSTHIPPELRLLIAACWPICAAIAICIFIVLIFIFIGGVIYGIIETIKNMRK